MTRAFALVMGLAFVATLAAAPGCKKKDEAPAATPAAKTAPAEPAPTPDKPET